MRAYLLVPAAGRHLFTALNTIVFPEMFSARKLIPLVNLVPLWAWTVLLVLIGGANLVAALLGGYRLGRHSLLVSAVATFVIGLGIEIGCLVLMLTGDQWILSAGFPEIGVLVLSLAAADYAVLAFGWTAPLDPPPTLPERT